MILDWLLVSELVFLERSDCDCSGSLILDTLSGGTLPPEKEGLDATCDRDVRLCGSSNEKLPAWYWTRATASVMSVPILIAKKAPSGARFSS